MASEAQLAAVKRAADIDDTDSTYTSTLLNALIDGSSVNKTILVVWREKAAAYSKLVNVSEGGSSRSMSDLWSHAKDMVAMYEGIVAKDEAAVAAPVNPLAGRSYTVGIERV